MIHGGLLLFACFVTAAGTFALVAYLWRYRSKPGAYWFLACLVCQALWNLTYGVALVTFDPLLRRVLEVLSLALLVGLSLFFLAFALEYTGRGQVGRTWTAMLLAAPFLTVAFGLTDPVHDLFWAGYGPARVWGLATVDYAFQPLTLAVGTVCILVPLVGSLLLFDTVLSYGPLYRREAFAVGLSTIPPTVALVAWFYGVGPLPQVNFAPFGFLPHVLLDAYAFVGSDMFEFHPATRRAGERAAIDDLGSPVVVVDDRARVVTLNPAAESVLGVEKADALTRPVDDYLDGDSIDPTEETQRITVRTGGTKRTFSVTATPLDVGSEDVVGYTLVLQDVTERIRREQRLSVLNRILRHNLRNDMNLVVGTADYARGVVDDEVVAEMLLDVEETANDLVSLGETARDVERVLDGDPDPSPVALERLLTDVAERASESVPGATVDVDCPAVEVTADGRTLRAVCEALVDNAVRHAGPDPTVLVAAEAGPDAVEIRVVDDGPGIPEAELAMIEAEEETPLDHGSGLGLWLVRWGAQRLGADVGFETGEDGTTATLSLPRE